MNTQHQVLTDEQIERFADHAADRIPQSNYVGRVIHAVRMAEEAIAAAAQAQPTADVLYDVQELLGHIADLLPDTEFNKIDTKLWNNVSRHTGAPTTGKREPLTQQDIDGILHASREADEGPTALIRRVERAITGEQR